LQLEYLTHSRFIQFQEVHLDLLVQADLWEVALDLDQELRLRVGDGLVDDELVLLNPQDDLDQRGKVPFLQQKLHGLLSMFPPKEQFCHLIEGNDFLPVIRDSQELFQLFELSEIYQIKGHEQTELQLSNLILF